MSTLEKKKQTGLTVMVYYLDNTGQSITIIIIC